MMSSTSRTCPSPSISACRHGRTARSQRPSDVLARVSLVTARPVAEAGLEAEELVGHEFNDDEDRVIAVRQMVALGAIMTVTDGCVSCATTPAWLLRGRIVVNDQRPFSGSGRHGGGELLQQVL